MNEQIETLNPRALADEASVPTSQGKQLSNHSKAVRWGQLRDSDTFAGATTKQVNPNYAVSFSLPVP